MVAVGLAGLVLGCLLGLRFRVMVLLPVEVGALVLASSAVAWGSVTALCAVAGFVLFSCSVQASYLAAVTSPLAARRASRRVIEA